MSHIKKEMQAPPPRSGNWEGLAPQRFYPYVPSKTRQKQREHGEGQMRRLETPSGIEGLTFDQAGRPVWRDPRLAFHSKGEVPQVEHVESSK